MDLFLFLVTIIGKAVINILFLLLSGHDPFRAPTSSLSADENEASDPQHDAIASSQPPVAGLQQPPGPLRPLGSAAAWHGRNATAIAVS